MCKGALKDVSKGGFSVEKGTKGKFHSYETQRKKQRRHEQCKGTARDSIRDPGQQFTLKKNC